MRCPGGSILDGQRLGVPAFSFQRTAGAFRELVAWLWRTAQEGRGTGEPYPTAKKDRYLCSWQVAPHTPEEVLRSLPPRSPP